MLIISYEILNIYDDSKYVLLSKKLTETSRLVCEGQQNDMDFSLVKEVLEEDYFNMIENKTAVLIGCCYMFGGIVSDLNTKDINILYEVGKNLGNKYENECKIKPESHTTKHTLVDRLFTHCGSILGNILALFGIFSNFVRISALSP